MFRHRINDQLKTIGEEFDYICPLKHKHKIEVVYDCILDTWKIDKVEKHPKPEEKEKEWEVIKRICMQVCCKICEREIDHKNYLGGFELNIPHDTESVALPICKECWDMNYLTWFKYDDEYYYSLHDYLYKRNIIGREDLKNCPYFFGYPHCGKENSDIFSKVDKKYISLFREEIDIEYEKDPGETEELKSTSEEKLYVSLQQAKCQHEFFNTSSKRQRCKKCFILKEKIKLTE